jgi:hypothetical protein
MNTNIVNQDISGGGESGLIGQDLSSTNSTVQFSQQPQVTMQPATPISSPVVEPTATPTNVIVPKSGQKLSSFPVEDAYLTALGVIVPVVAVAFWFTESRKVIFNFSFMFCVDME